MLNWQIKLNACDLQQRSGRSKKRFAHPVFFSDSCRTLIAVSLEDPMLLNWKPHTNLSPRRQTKSCTLDGREVGQAD